MKKIMSLCFAVVMLVQLCACSAQAEPEETKSPYSDVIARLEAGDYDGARSLIDMMEDAGQTEETVLPQTQPAAEATQPDGTEPVQYHPAETEPQPAAVHNEEIVELAEYNVKDYFELSTTYYVGEDSGCSQTVELKEEYKDRLLRLENVTVTISYLEADAFGTVDVSENEFQEEYFDILSTEKQRMTVEIDEDGLGWITRIPYSRKKGCFPGYAADMGMETGSGKLILTAE